MNFIKKGISSKPKPAIKIKGACQLIKFAKYNAKGMPTVEATANEDMIAPIALPLRSYVNKSDTIEIT